MTFFVTGAGPGKGADLGGIEGATSTVRCWRSATAPGAKTWHAYLSTQAADGKPAINARDRIGKSVAEFQSGWSRRTSTTCGDSNKLG